MVVVGVAGVLNTLFFSTSFSSVTSSSTPCAMWARLSSVMKVSDSGFFFRARVLTSVRVTEVWQDFFDQLEAQVESRRGFPRIRIATDVVPQQAKEVARQCFQSCFCSRAQQRLALFARHAHERDEPLRLNSRWRPRNHHCQLIQCRQVKLLPRGFCGWRIVHVPESDKVDRHVAADAGPAMSRKNTDCSEAQSSQFCRFCGTKPSQASPGEQWPRKERSKYHASGIKREACGDGCGQASPLQCSRKQESSLTPKLHLHFDALKMSGLALCGASVSDSALSCKGLLS